MTDKKLQMLWQRAHLEQYLYYERSVFTHTNYSVNFRLKALKKKGKRGNEK